MAINIPIITEFNGKGIERARKEFQQLEGASAKAAFVMKKAFVPATAALGALAVALGDATKAAIADQAAASELARSLRQTTGATDDIIASTEDWISQQGRLLGIADDQLRPALSRLARATGSVEKAQRLASQAMDIAQATGKPLEVVVQALERAYGGNMTALQKLAPEYRTLIKSGASFEDVMSQLALTTGGAAAEAANTAEGKLRRFEIALRETKEAIGNIFLPVLEAVLPYLQQFGMWAEKNPAAFVAVAAAIGAIAAAIVAVNIAMAFNPIGAIAAGIALLIVGLVAAYNKFEGFRNIVDAVFQGLKWYIGMAKDNFLALVGVFKAVFNGLASAWNNTIGKFNFKVPSWVPGLGGQGFDMPNIPMLADGGIVPYRPGGTLAIVGEAGPEAVVPLDRAGGMGTNVTINVQGADPEAVVDALRTYMFRNGAVPIRVA